MAISILINDTDRTDVVLFGSVQKTDTINNQTDTLSFIINSHEAQPYIPENGDEVKMYDGATLIFAGRIQTISKEIILNGVVRVSVKCSDYSFELSRQLVVEEYKNKTIAEIIIDIIDNYTSGITYENVDCDLDVSKIIFDRKNVTEALNKLSEVSGYSWYVDYEKDLHFFEKNTEPAPFDIEDGDGNCIINTLRTKDDLSQIRNRIFIKGGEIEGEDREELFNGDGEKLQFKLANKFASLPTVEVDSVEQSVGVDYVDDEDEFDCFWDFNQQYIRFKTDTTPDVGTNNIVVTGTPLFNIIVQVEDPVSISQYGLYEYVITDKTIASREEAVARAKSELSAYKDGLIEGSFDTYTSGLRSGQVIHITSDKLGVDEDFLIQRASYNMISIDQGYWKITLATLRTVGIIDFLIDLLKSGDRIIKEEGDSLLEKTIFPQESISFGEVVEINTNDYPQTEEYSISELNVVQEIDFDTVFVAGPYIPDIEDEDDTNRVFILNGSRLG